MEQHNRAFKLFSGQDLLYGQDPIFLLRYVITTLYLPTLCLHIFLWIAYAFPSLCLNTFLWIAFPFPSSWFQMPSPPFFRSIWAPNEPESGKPEFPGKISCFTDTGDPFCFLKTQKSPFVSRSLTACSNPWKISMSGAQKTNLLSSTNFQFDTSGRLSLIRSFLKKKNLLLPSKFIWRYPPFCFKQKTYDFGPPITFIRRFPRVPVASRIIEITRWRKVFWLLLKFNFCWLRPEKILLKIFE
jgi:hypothetical protein